MHDAAYAWLSHAAATLPPRRWVLEFGSRDINGSPRPIFAGAADSYLGIDVRGGPGVNLVHDAATFTPGGGDDPRAFDTVICAEVLEHATDPAAVCRNAARLLMPRGVFLVTAASPERAPHSGVDGGELRPGEHYRAVTRADLLEWLGHGFLFALINDSTPGDVYALAFT